MELHGFLSYLSYLVKCNLERRTYTMFGYKGKQVRDNIHSEDVIRFIHTFIESPRCGAVYNIVGGRRNSTSILEAFKLVEELTGIAMVHRYSHEARVGDHICYISDLTRIRTDYPTWEIRRDLPSIMREIVEACQRRLQACAKSSPATST